MTSGGRLQAEFGEIGSSCQRASRAPGVFEIVEARRSWAGARNSNRVESIHGALIAEAEDPRLCHRLYRATFPSIDGLQRMSGGNPRARFHLYESNDLAATSDEVDFLPPHPELSFEYTPPEPFEVIRS